MDREDITERKEDRLPSEGTLRFFRGQLGLKHAFLLVLTYLGAQLLGVILASLVMGIWYGAHGVHDPAAFKAEPLATNILATAILTGTLLAAVCSYLLVRRWAGLATFGREPTDVGLHRSELPGVLEGLLAGVVLAGITAGLLILFPADPDKLNGPLAQLQKAGGYPFAVLIVIGIMIAPLFEEFFFRGALLAALIHRWNATVAITVSTVLFVALHAADKLDYPPGFIAVAILALTNCWLRLRNRSLVPAMLSHFVYNTLLFILF